MKYSKKQIQLFHVYSSAHRSRILAHDVYGCFFCCKIQPISNIKEWTDDGDTAICSCGIDACLPKETGLFQINEELLKQMNKFWFRSIK